VSLRNDGLRAAKVFLEKGLHGVGDAKKEKILQAYINQIETYISPVFDGHWNVLDQEIKSFQSTLVYTAIYGNPAPAMHTDANLHNILVMDQSDDPHLKFNDNAAGAIEHRARTAIIDELARTLFAVQHIGNLENLYTQELSNEGKLKDTAQKTETMELLRDFFISYRNAMKESLLVSGKLKEALARDMFSGVNSEHILKAALFRARIQRLSDAGYFLAQTLPRVLKEATSPTSWEALTKVLQLLDRVVADLQLFGQGSSWGELEQSDQKRLDDPTEYAKTIPDKTKRQPRVNDSVVQTGYAVIRERGMSEYGVYE
jgi:hypothetical protein